MVKITYKTGDKVFAKVKGYPPWPAQVVGDTGKKKYNVLFYGTQETGAIKPEDLSYYLKYKDSYVHKYLKRAGYEDAVKEIEEAIKKDGGDGNDTPSGEDFAQDPEISDTSSVSSTSEKKAPKRKVSSLLVDEPPTKRTPAKGRRKSIATADSKEENSEEPAAKKLRRKSNTSTEENSEELAAKKSEIQSIVSAEEDAEEPTAKDIQRKSSEGTSEEPTAKKPRRKSSVSTAENSEEPTSKRPRRKSNGSIESKDEDEEKKSNDNGMKEETIEDIKDASVETEDEFKIEKQNTINPEDVTGSNKREKNADVENKTIVEKKKENFVKQSEVEATRTKEPEFETNTDERIQIEEESSEVADKPADKTAIKVDIVTEQSLHNDILYAEHVKKHSTMYKDKPVETRQTRKDEVFAVRLPSGKVCGVKLHKQWPLEHTNEHDRALYDEKVAKLALEVGNVLSSGKKSIHEVDLDIIPDIEMTTEDLKEISYRRDIESKRKRLDRLKKEADLVTWDSKMKNNLGLDKASPDVALESFKDFNRLENDLDALMLKKHPHVVDTVRRLRRYVGNIKEWEMSEQDVENFTHKAEKIRNEAEKIYNKIKNAIKIPEEKGTFWDCFMDLVAEFRTKCKSLSENEVMVLCAEPYSRQAFFDKLDEVTESEGTGINQSNTSEPVLKETSVQGWKK